MADPAKLIVHTSKNSYLAASLRDALLYFPPHGRVDQALIHFHRTLLPLLELPNSPFRQILEINLICSYIKLHIPKELFDVSAMHLDDAIYGNAASFITSVIRAIGHLIISHPETTVPAGERCFSKTPFRSGDGRPITPPPIIVKAASNPPVKQTRLASERDSQGQINDAQCYIPRGSNPDHLTNIPRHRLSSTPRDCQQPPMARADYQDPYPNIYRSPKTINNVKFPRRKTSNGLAPRGTPTCPHAAAGHPRCPLPNYHGTATKYFSMQQLNVDAGPSPSLDSQKADRANASLMTLLVGVTPEITNALPGKPIEMPAVYSKDFAVTTISLQYYKDHLFTGNQRTYSSTPNALNKLDYPGKEQPTTSPRGYVRMIFHIRDDAGCLHVQEQRCYIINGQKHPCYLHIPPHLHDTARTTGEAIYLTTPPMLCPGRVPCINHRVTLTPKPIHLSSDVGIGTNKSSVTLSPGETRTIPIITIPSLTLYNRKHPHFVIRATPQSSSRNLLIFAFSSDNPEKQKLATIHVTNNSDKPRTVPPNAALVEYFVKHDERPAKTSPTIPPLATSYRDAVCANLNQEQPQRSGKPSLMEQLVRATANNQCLTAAPLLATAKSTRPHTRRPAAIAKGAFPRVRANCNTRVRSKRTCPNGRKIHLRPTGHHNHLGTQTFLQPVQTRYQKARSNTPNPSTPLPGGTTLTPPNRARPAPPAAHTPANQSQHTATRAQTRTRNPLGTARPHFWRPSDRTPEHTQNRFSPLADANDRPDSESASDFESTHSSPNTPPESPTTSKKPQRKKDHLSAPSSGEEIERVTLNARILQDGIISKKTLIREQKLDPFYADISQHKNATFSPNGILLWKPPKPERIYTEADLFDVAPPNNEENDTNNIVNPPKIFLPAIFHSTVIRQTHETVFGAHTSLTQTKQDILSRFYHPLLSDDIESHVSACLICKITDTQVKPSSSGKLPVPPKRTMFYCDLAKAHGNNRFFIAVDPATLFTYITVLPGKEAEPLYNAILQLHSNFMCTAIKFDQERGAYPKLPDLNALGIDISYSPAHSPMSNSYAEKRVGLAKRFYRKLRLTDDMATDNELAAFIATSLNRIRPKSATISPETMMYGNTLPRPNDILPIYDEIDDQALQKIIDTFTRIRETRADLIRQKANVKRRTTNYERGDQVFVLVNPIRPNHTLRPTVEGPFTFLEYEKDHFAAVLRNPHTQAITKRRVDHLLPANCSFKDILLARNLDKHVHPNRPTRTLHNF